jgi:hypothetical protein
MTLQNFSEAVRAAVQDSQITGELAQLNAATGNGAAFEDGHGAEIQPVKGGYRPNPSSAPIMNPSTPGGGSVHHPSGRSYPKPR